MIPGITLQLGEREYVVPPLSLGQLRSGLMDIIKQHDELLRAENTDFTEVLILRGKIICAALTRNYPDLTEDEAFGFLDYSNTLPAWNAVLGLSGFVGVGETQGVATDVPVTTLLPSTPVSQPLMDGTNG